MIKKAVVYYHQIAPDNPEPPVCAGRNICLECIIMINEKMYALGANRSCIRDLFEYGCQRAAIVGRENVYDYSLATPPFPLLPK